MICPNCSANFNDGMLYCPNCGTPVNVNNGYREPQYAQQNEPYTMPNYSMPEYPQPKKEEHPTVGKYVLWLILGMSLGPISLVISIVFACMGENKTRASFFRACLVIWAISIGIGIVLGIVLSIVGLSLFNIAGASAYGYFDEYLALAMTVL